jgi:structure-specific recognition protein 1
MNPYMAFSMEERKRIVAENPSMKSDIGGVAKLVGKAWGALSAAEKAKYAKKGASMKTKTKKAKKSKKGADAEVEETGGKKGKTRKSGKKRALSGFMKFSMKERASVMKENPGIAFGAVGKELGKRWGALSDAEKKKYA